MGDRIDLNLKNISLFIVFILGIGVFSFFMGRWSAGSENYQSVQKRKKDQKQYEQESKQNLHESAETDSVETKEQTLKTGTESKADADSKKGYILQIEALKSRKSAFNLKDELEKEGFPVYVDEENGKEGRTLYRIRVGKYYSRKVVKSTTEKLEKRGHDVWTIKE